MYSEILSAFFLNKVRAYCIWVDFIPAHESKSVNFSLRHHFDQKKIYYAVDLWSMATKTLHLIRSIVIALWKRSSLFEFDPWFIFKSVFVNTIMINTQSATDADKDTSSYPLHFGYQDLFLKKSNLVTTIRWGIGQISSQ